MYKFLYNNQILHAPGFLEAMRQAGLALPEDINPISHFIVRIWHWDDNGRDFVIEVFDTPGHQVFNEYDDALTCFNTLAIKYQQVTSEEFKLELVQFHRGRVSSLHSKILFPPVLAMEP
jgi:hypothetical protein